MIGFVVQAHILASSAKDKLPLLSLTHILFVVVRVRASSSQAWLIKSGGIWDLIVELLQ